MLPILNTEWDLQSLTRLNSSSISIGHRCAIACFWKCPRITLVCWSIPVSSALGECLSMTSSIEWWAGIHASFQCSPKSSRATIVKQWDGFCRTEIPSQVSSIFQSLSLFLLIFISGCPMQQLQFPLRLNPQSWT